MNSVKRYSDQEFSNDLPYDLHPISFAKVEDLSKVIFENEYLPAAFSKEILDANNRSYEERLSSCKMIVSPDDTTPTILGLLALGKNSYDFVPGSYVQFLRINGTELSDPIIDEEAIKGILSDIIRRTEEKLKAHNRTAVDIKHVPQITTIDSPERDNAQIL